MKTKKYKPNFISLKIRMWLSIAAVFLLLFALAGFATGYTFIPGKRGGLLLSGIPTFMIGLASLALCSAALLSIVDHYDKRPNEHEYQFYKKLCYMATLYLFIAAPLVELFEHILLLNGIDVFPDFHGFAEKFTFYSPDLHRYLSYIDPFTNAGLVVGGVTFTFFVAGWVLMKYFSGRLKKAGVLFALMGLFGLAYMILVFSAQDFLLGEVEEKGVTYQAMVEPAKFNAILLMHFIIGGFLLLISTASVVGIITRRIKLLDDW